MNNNTVTIPYMSTGVVYKNGNSLEVNIPQLERLLAVAKAKAEAARVPSVEIVLGSDEHFRIGTVIRVEKRYQTSSQLYTYIATKVDTNYWVSSAKAEGCGTFDLVFGNIWKDAAYIATTVAGFGSYRSEFPKPEICF